jgi:hypothetical protein
MNNDDENFNNAISLCVAKYNKSINKSISYSKSFTSLPLLEKENKNNVVMRNKKNCIV